jgi:hypothetical protein
VTPVAEPTLFPVTDPGKRTASARARSTIGTGKHPATGRCLLRVTDRASAGVCCGDCAHARAADVWRCAAPTGPGVPAPAIRISWPACVRYQPAPRSASGIQRHRFR